MLVQFGPEDVPASFDAFVDLEDAIWDEIEQRWVPGIEDCASPATTLDITKSGLYDLAIPIGEECECAHLNYWYFISFQFITSFEKGKQPDAVTDNLPVGSTSFIDFGSGWQDLQQQHSFPGEIIIWVNSPAARIPS